jgi:membrane fusion protein (multidrug efflux system)
LEVRRLFHCCAGDPYASRQKEPFQIAVAIKEAAVDTAMADLQVAKSNMRGIEAEAMSRRLALEHAMEDVDNQVVEHRLHL